MSASLPKMNASSWRKAADLMVQETQANQQIQVAATADSSQPASLSAHYQPMIVVHHRCTMVQNNPSLQVHQGQIQH